MMYEHDQLIIHLSCQISYTIKSRLAISYSSPTRMSSRYDYNFKMVYLYLSQGSKKMSTQTRENWTSYWKF